MELIPTQKNHPVVQVEIEVRCKKCNTALCMRSEVVYSPGRGMPVLLVEPCFVCLRDTEAELRKNLEG